MGSPAIFKGAFVKFLKNSLELFNGVQISFPSASTTLVGTDSTQQLTNKDIQGGTASDARRIVLPSNTLANLNTLADVAGSIALNTTSNKPAFNDGTNWVDLGSASAATPTIAGVVTSYEPVVQSSVLTIATGDWVANAYTLSTTDGYTTIRCDTGGTARTLNLPAVGSNTGRVYRIKLIGSTPSDLSFNVTLDGLTYVLKGYTNYVDIVCQGGGYEIVGEGPSLKPNFRAYVNSSQVIPDALGTDTAVTFNTEDWDVGSYYDTSNGRFTPRVAGNYLITASIAFLNSSINTGDAFRISVRKNGSVVVRKDLNGFAYGGGGNGRCFNPIDQIVRLNGSTDYVDITASQETGLGTLAVDQNTAHSWFQAHYVGRFD